MSASNVVALPVRQRQDLLERLVLGALLQLGQLGHPLRTVLDACDLRPDELRDARVALAWRLVCALVARGAVVSAATVFASGRTARLLGDAEGEWLEGLARASAVGPDELPPLLDELRASVRAEQLAGTLRAAAEQARVGSTDVDALLRQAAAFQSEPGVAETAAGALERLRARREAHATTGRGRTLSPTGLHLLDELIGGLPWSLVVLTGDPGAGKTGTEVSMIRGILEQSSSAIVGLFALEDGSDWLVRRWAAEDTGIALRDINWRQGTPEQEDALALAYERLQPLARRVYTYSVRSLRTSDAVRVASAWQRQHGDSLRHIFLDNYSQVDFSPKTKEERWTTYPERVASSAESLRACAEDLELALCVLVHQVAPDNARRFREPAPPPQYGGTRGGAAIEQKARLSLGVWVRGDAWRLTVLKGNETPGVGRTLELSRHPEAGTVAREGGLWVDWRGELAQERRGRESEKAAERDRSSEIRREAKVKAKAAAKAAVEAAKKPAQEALL